MTVQYFEVNEERKSFEAQYSTFADLGAKLSLDDNKLFGRNYFRTAQ